MESTAARQASPPAWAGRIEDDALLRGAGRFGDDVKPAGALAAYFVRSPHAFATIEHIDVAAAKRAPGVVAVLTAADLAEAHYHSISHPHPIPGRGGKAAVAPHRPSLAASRVLHVGEPVAMVIAVSAQAAQDAGEKVAVDYQPLDAVTDVRAAAAIGAPQLWPEAPGNIGFDWSAPADPDGKKQVALERAFKNHPDDIAAVIVEPAMMNVGIVLPDAGYLAGIKEIAHRNGALLIFDEVKTGVTIARGGATERFGVQPDVIALAKAIGGGLPCGAVGGRQDVMAVIEDKRVAQMGTFNGNPLTLAAAKVTLQDILTPKAYAHFDALAEVLQGGLDGVIRDNALPFHVTTLTARGSITYKAERVRNYRDYLGVDKPTAYLSWLYQCNRGVLMAPGAEENWTLSVQHSQEDVQRYVDNFAELAHDLRA